jgi:DNA (cytosine-5)-methyltransferase 1
MKVRFGELFSGPGGMALGAHRAAARFKEINLLHSWANDYDRSTCDTYIRNIPGASPATVHCADIASLAVEDLDPIDGFAFGFPCNDFSQVGERLGTDGAFGPLYTHGIRVIDAHDPTWFVAENVGGIRSANSGHAFKKILKDLANSGNHGGYQLTPHLYRFEQYGVPQARHRIIIVGVRADQEFSFAVPSPEPYAHLDVSVKECLESPPIGEDLPNNERTRQSPRVIQRLENIRPGRNAFNSDLPAHLKLNVAGAKISQIYKRLDPTKPSYTVTGSGGGGTHVYHWAEPRALTNRERARIQTFPDSFVFEGTKESVRRQIGMAVPVKGAEVIFDALFKSMLGVDYPRIQANLAVTS